LAVRDSLQEDHWEDSVPTLLFVVPVYVRFDLPKDGLPLVWCLQKMSSSIVVIVGY